MASDALDFERLAKVSKAFRPAKPIDTETLFAGRQKQMGRIIDVVFQPGQHGLVYGSRGVGKTSLAQVMAEVMKRASGTSALFYTCSSGDTFDAIWRSILEDIQFIYTVGPVGFSGTPERQEISALDHLGRIIVNHDGSPRVIRPDDVRRALTVTAPSDEGQQVIIIDEFDRIEESGEATRRLFADTIKALSDQGVRASIIIVGVADSVDQLIEHHPSVERCISQIYMPTMSEDELTQIIDNGMKIAELEVDPDFTREVVRLAHGIPSYVHLLGQSAARIAVEEDRHDVRRADLQAAIERSIEQVDESVQSAYSRATTSNRETLYKHVLLACALAERDERDTFSAADVRDQLVTITGEYKDIPAFSQHLKDFSGDGDRGGILTRLGTQRRYRYRFVNPLLPPFVLMKGHVGIVGQDQKLPMWLNEKDPTD